MNAKCIRCGSTDHKETGTKRRECRDCGAEFHQAVADIADDLEILAERTDKPGQFAKVLLETGGVKDNHVQDVKEGYIYVIADDDGNVKIGRSTRPRERLRSLQTGHPGELEILDAVGVPDMAIAEKKLHDDYDHARTSGEWFDLTEDEIAELERRLADLKGLVGSGVST